MQFNIVLDQESEVPGMIALGKIIVQKNTQNPEKYSKLGRKKYSKNSKRYYYVSQQSKFKGKTQVWRLWH